MITKSQLDTLIATAHNIYQDLKHDDSSPTHSRHALEMCSDLSTLQHDLMEMVFNQTDCALDSETFYNINEKIAQNFVDLLVLIKVCDTRYNMNDLMAKSIEDLYKRSKQP